MKSSMKKFVLHLLQTLWAKTMIVFTVCFAILKKHLQQYIINITIHNIYDKFTYEDYVVEDLLSASYTKVVSLRILQIEIAFNPLLRSVVKWSDTL